MPRQELKDFFPTISLGQKISAQKDSHMKEYAGSDVELAKQFVDMTRQTPNLMELRETPDTKRSLTDKILGRKKPE